MRSPERAGGTISFMRNEFRDWALRHQGPLFAAGAVTLLFAVLLTRRYSQDLNYTFVIATALLHGELGTHVAPPWLNEMVPAGGGLYYSVFPLGAVLSVLPFSLMVALGVAQDYPVNLVVALLAAGCFGAAYAVTMLRPQFSVAKRLMLASWLVVGSWFLTNMLFAGAWQIALGFAVLAGC